MQTWEGRNPEAMILRNAVFGSECVPFFSTKKRKTFQFFRIKNMEPMISSLLFITNVLNSLWYQQYLYSFLFLMLTLTSILFYSHPNIYTNAIDKCAIGAVVMYGGYLLYTKNKNNLIHVGLILSSFLMVVVLFFYGYCTNQYCYDPQYGNHYHCLLHGISSLGHHGILLLN